MRRARAASSGESGERRRLERWAASGGASGVTAGRSQACQRLSDTPPLCTGGGRAGVERRSQRASVVAPLSPGCAPGVAGICCGNVVSTNDRGGERQSYDARGPAASTRHSGTTRVRPLVKPARVAIIVPAPRLSVGSHWLLLSSYVQTLCTSGADEGTASASATGVGWRRLRRAGTSHAGRWLAAEEVMNDCLGWVISMQGLHGRSQKLRCRLWSANRRRSQALCELAQRRRAQLSLPGALAVHSSQPFQQPAP